MKFRFSAQLAPALLVLSIGAWAVATDQIIEDDLITQGSHCIGTDCVSGEMFEGSTLKLKENNLRIRLLDTTVTEGNERSWTLVANDSGNGGAEYMRFAWQSNQQDTPVLSDGTATDYQCDNLPYPGTVVGTIPAGEPIETYFCEPVYTYRSRPALSLGKTGTTLGTGSESAHSDVSVGAAKLTRRLRHLAAAVADTDVLTKHQMESFDLLKARREQLAQLSAGVDQLEADALAYAESLAGPAPVGDSDSDGVATLGALPGPLVMMLLVLFGLRRRSQP
jgi:hypothetical protein